MTNESKPMVSIDGLNSMDFLEKKSLIGELNGLSNGAELAAELMNDENPYLRCFLLNECLKAPDDQPLINKVELIEKFSNDPNYEVRERLARIFNIAAYLPNAEEVATRLSLDSSASVRVGLTATVGRLTNGAELAARLCQDSHYDVRSILNYQLKNAPVTEEVLEAVKFNKRITFHIPADNQALTGHEANLAIQISQNTLEKLEALRSTSAHLGQNQLNQYTVSMENDPNDRSAPLIELNGLTFEGDDSKVYKGVLSISGNGDLNVKAFADEKFGWFENYAENTINLSCLRFAFDHAVDVGARDVVIDDKNNSQYARYEPEVVKELGLFSVENLGGSIRIGEPILLTMENIAAIAAAPTIAPPIEEFSAHQMKY